MLQRAGLTNKCSFCKSIEKTEKCYLLLCGEKIFNCTEKKKFAFLEEKI